jgi:hypothetical protein
MSLLIELSLGNLYEKDEFIVIDTLNALVEKLKV